MSNAELEQMLKDAGLDPNEVKPIGDTLTNSRKWDYKHSDLLNVPIVIFSYDSITTSYGEAFLAECFVKGERVSVLIGSSVLMDQLEEAEGSLPVAATITKVKQYYSFR